MILQFPKSRDCYFRFVCFELVCFPMSLTVLPPPGQNLRVISHLQRYDSLKVFRRVVDNIGEVAVQRNQDRITTSPRKARDGSRIGGSGGPYGDGESKLALPEVTGRGPPDSLHSLRPQTDIRIFGHYENRSSQEQ